MRRNFAILETHVVDNVETQVVENIVVALAWPGGIDITDMDVPPTIGWRYELVEGEHVFTAPLEIEPVETRAITNLAFMERFTPAELGHLKLVAQINPAAVVEEQQISADIAVYNDKLFLAKFIDLNDPRTLGGLQQLEWLGVLATGRALEMINAPVLDIERP